MLCPILPPLQTLRTALSGSDREFRKFKAPKVLSLSWLLKWDDRKGSRRLNAYVNSDFRHPSLPHRNTFFLASFSQFNINPSV